MSKGKTVIIAFSALCLTQPYFSVLTNHSQQLEEMADGTSTYSKDLIQEEGNYYKKGVKRDRRSGG